jgi:hypothetical protein
MQSLGAHGLLGDIVPAGGVSPFNWID